MRIGLVTQAYYPVLGGVTEHVWHLGHELQRRGHEVTVITGATRPSMVPWTTKRDEDRGLRTIRIGWQIPTMLNGANAAMTLGWKLGRQLQRIEAREKFDVVHVQSGLDPGLPLVASKSMRTPKVATYHTYRDPSNSKIEQVPNIFRPVFQDAINKIQAHIAVSPAAASFVHRYFPNVKLDVIPNGIDIDRFHPAIEPMPLKKNNQEFIILFVGRMDPRKGAKFLFAALPELERRMKNYRIVVVGTGWMQSYYDAHIPLNLRQRVEFTGYASPEDIPRYYRAADVYCSPATGNESFGIVLLEAMACGTPVIASDIEGYRWVVTPGKEGILVPPRSPEHLAAAIAMLADDPAGRKEMGQQGQQTAQKYAWPKIVNQIEQVYRRVAQ
jgi:phosphatidylinositol alpha-mannosyltransferase